MLLAAVVVLAAGGLHLATARAAPAATAAFVRVNQVGYPAAAAEACLPDGQRGRDRRHLRRQRLVRGDRLFGADRRRTSARGATPTPIVYALDFNAVTTAGTYTISVTGPVAATSPSFRIDTGASLYARAAGQRAVLLSDRARRPELHRQRPAHRARRT